MIPADERKVSDLLKSVTIGSPDALDEPANRRCRAGAHARDRQPIPTNFPDDLAAVRERNAAMPPIILGKDMAADLGATVGSVVLVTSPQGELTPFGMVPKYIRFKVAGIFKSGFYDYDSAWAFTRLSDAQKLFGLGDIVSVLEFKVDDIYSAGEVAHQLERHAGNGFMATNWMEQNKAMFRALRLERVVTFITIGLIVFVAALNILISLIMMVMEKTKDIAVLMSMGAESPGTPRLHRAGHADRRDRHRHRPGAGLRAFPGRAAITTSFRSPPRSTPSITCPLLPRLADGMLVALVALGISFVATLYPSWSASRILPAEALRYE